MIYTENKIRIRISYGIFRAYFVNFYSTTAYTFTMFLWHIIIGPNYYFRQEIGLEKCSSSVF